jgi:uncharacterized protein YjlB
LMPDKRVNTNPSIIAVKTKHNKGFPNSHLPVLIYQQVLGLPLLKNKSADIVETIFAKNGWKNSWRNGIYDFHHYHSTTHECMAVNRGSAKIILGGPKGKNIVLHKDDVIIIPAGVAHKCISHSKDFHCIGAYPQGKDYDILRGTTAEYEAAIKRINKLALPKHDPVYGKQGFLKSFWNK